jgi:hypothetical protein
MKSFIALAVIIASQTMVTPATFAQNQFPQQPGVNSYYSWCDNVQVILNNATRLANSLYGQTKFTQAKQVMVNAFQQALSSSSLPGSFRPNTYKELVRTIDLVRTLEAANIPNPVLKDKMIAYVTLNRVDVVLKVKNTLDRPYVIPTCYNRSCNGRGSYQTQYGTPAVDMGQFEATLASIARLQLQTAQTYSTRVIPGRQIQVYPLVDAPTYFTIISKAAQWAAEDLSMTLFGSTFACAIIELQNLGAEAASMAAMAGDVYAVQYIHQKVDVLKSALRIRPYGCGGVQYPTYGGGYDNSSYDNGYDNDYNDQN